MAVLVTGGGLVGTQVAALLAAAGQRVVLYDRAPRSDRLSGSVAAVEGDILDRERLVAVCKAEQVTTVVHTAASLGEALRRSPFEAQRVNVLGTAAVAEACLQVAITKLVYVSSLTVFTGDGGWQGCREEERPAPASLYGATKLAAENLLHGYRTSYGLPFVTVRLASIYGPGPEDSGGWLSRSLQRALHDAVAGRPVTLPDSGDCLYVKDAAQGILRALAFGRPGRTYHLGAGHLIAQAELADAFRELFPTCDLAPVGPAPSQALWLDTSRAERELRFLPQYSIGAALADWLTAIRHRAEGAAV